MRIVVVRAFLLRGARQEPGTTIDVSDAFGIEMVAMGKAERAADEPPPASGPMTVAGTPALVPPVATTDEAGPPAADDSGEPASANASAPQPESAPQRRRKGN